jgi:uncharacterized membrane protein
VSRERRHRGRGGAPPPAPPGRDWRVAAVAAIGLGVGAYLTVTRLAGGTALFCTDRGGCEVVQASRYAVFLGVPTAAWGAGLYALVGGLALAGLGPGRWLLAFVLTVVAVAFSAYLTYLEIAVIGALCGYCVVSAAVAAGLFGLVLGRRPAGRWRWLRPARLAALGSATALITVAAGIGGFAATAPRAEASYQEALARHLQASGAIMYGAFW